MDRMRNRGLSLIEVVMAMFLFFIAMTLVFGVFPACHLAADQGLRRSIGRQLAQEFMSAERAKPFSQVRSLGTFPVSVPVTRNGVDSVLKYQVSVSVVPGATVKEVLVEVAWEQGRSVKLEGVVVNL
ncbi:MAG: prepilin-type N-terminal cleavage/methylation domain-containing protein [Candidatus Eremiobacterota bacterium]